MKRRQWKKLVRQGRCPWCKNRRHHVFGIYWMHKDGGYRKMDCFRCGRTATQTKEAGKCLA